MSEFLVSKALPGRPTCRVDEAAAFLGISERSMRRALDPGGDLAALSLRIGHRQLVKVPALLALVGLEPSHSESGPATGPLLATATTPEESRDDTVRPVTPIRSA